MMPDQISNWHFSPVKNAHMNLPWNHKITTFRCLVGKVESNANLSPNWVGVGKIFKVNIWKFKLLNILKTCLMALVCIRRSWCIFWLPYRHIWTRQILNGICLLHSPYILSPTEGFLASLGWMLQISLDLGVLIFIKFHWN